MKYGAGARGLIALALLLLPTACGQNPESKGDAVQGRVLAERNCQSCHAIGPSGDSPVPESPAFRDIVKRYSPEDLAESLAEGIDVSHEGKVQMPPMSFEPHQIDDLIAYLKTLEKKD